MSVSFGYQLLGSSEAFGRTKRQIEKVTKAGAAVLVEGETGTGKEMVARAIHYMGSRHEKPFVPVNCGALAEHLVESELFGHERGAFTDAKSASLGLVHEAGGGTLFLDEIDALGAKAQAALLRFLQDGVYRRVGGSSMRQADLRVVVASNANLKALSNERHFRKDLYYRVSVLVIHVPPLRERGNDVVELANVFLARLARQSGCDNARLNRSSIAFMLQYDWPGNVRELENAVQRAFLLRESDEIDLAAAVLGEQAQMNAESRTEFKQAKNKAVADFERLYLGELLSATNGNMTRAAVLAGQDRSAFGRLVRKHGLRPPRVDNT